MPGDTESSVKRGICVRSLARQNIARVEVG